MLFAFLRFLLGFAILIFFGNLSYAIDGYTKAAEKIVATSQENIHAIFNSKDKNYKNGQLYYFISFSMSDSLIKNYLQEAAANKGILVLRGISPGMNLHDFLLQKLLPLLQDPENPQAVYANIEINPHLFSQYEITQVPTLVYVRDEKHYWKVSGPVTGKWALELFSHL